MAFARKYAGGLLLILGAVIAVPVLVIADGYMRAAEAGGWTGCYLGAAGGYSSANTDTKITQGAFVVDVDSLGYAGGTYAGLLGCDLQVAPKIVLGVFGDYSKANNADFDVTIAPGFNGSIVHTGLDTSWAVGGRAGYLVTPGALVYVLAGYTQANTQDISFPAFVGAKPISVPTLDGYVVGGGVETSIGSGWFLQTQATWANYDAAVIALNANPNGPKLSLDTDVLSARVGLTYKFGTETPIVRDVANAVAPSAGHTPLK